VLSSYSGGDAATALDGTPTSHVSGTASGTVDYDTLTTATNGSLVSYAVTEFGGTNKSVPSGTTPTYTERVEFVGMAQGDGTLATAGATGAQTGTIATPSWNIGQVMALTPAGGGGFDPTTVPFMQPIFVAPSVAVAGF
jgi:hypothetical protein